MEELVRTHAIAVSLALVIGYLGRYVEPRSRLVHWFPAYFEFRLPNPAAGADNAPANVSVWTHQLTVQNQGYRAAKGIEIVHKQKPPHFQIQPGLMYTEAANPEGHHVIRIETLARREWVAIQILSAGNRPPDLVSIRSTDGPSRFTQTGFHFVWAKWRLWLGWLFLAVGFATYRPRDGTGSPPHLTVYPSAYAV